MTPNKESFQGDSVKPVEVHYGDIVVTVGQRFDKLDKQLLLISKAILVLAAGELVLLGIHLPEVGPILVSIVKMFARN
jgi:hypothetical protein